MAIPLVGSPPVAKLNVKEILTGDSSTFATSVGNWTTYGSGTTLSLSSTYFMPTSAGNSLKLINTQQNAGGELVISGSFIAGKVYDILVSFLIEDIDFTNSPDGALYYQLWVYGNAGGPPRNASILAQARMAHTNSGSNNFGLRRIRWVPIVSHTSATIRFITASVSRLTSYSSTAYVGSLEVVEILNVSDAGLAVISGDNDWVSVIAPEIDISSGVMGGTVLLADYSAELLSNNDTWQTGFGTYAGGPSGDGYTYQWAEHQPHGVANSGGVAIETGQDWIGIAFSERDYYAMNIQAEGQSGIDIDLVDEGLDTSYGWNAESRGGSRVVRLSKAVENPFTEADDILIGTTKSYIVSNRTSSLTGTSGSKWVGAGTAEGVVPGGYISTEYVVIPGEPVTVDYDFWYSHYDYNSQTGSKSTTVKLRRTNVTGTQLATQTSTDTSTSPSGHQFNFVGSYVDSSPTDGVYLLTASTDLANSYIYSDTKVLTVSTTGTGDYTRLGKGNDNDILTVSPVTGHVSWQAPGLVSTTSPTGSYTLVLGDAGKVVEVNSGSASTLTIPENAIVTFPVGTSIGVYQAGAGVVTISPTGAAVIRAANGTDTGGQYSEVKLRKRATDEWVISGDTA